MILYIFCLFFLVFVVLAILTSLSFCFSIRPFFSFGLGVSNRLIALLQGIAASMGVKNMLGGVGQPTRASWFLL